MNQFKKDKLTTNIKGTGLLLLILLGVFYCSKVKGQETLPIGKDTVNSFRLISHIEYGVTEIDSFYSVFFESGTKGKRECRFTFVSTFTTSEDTTEVAYVVLEQVKDSFTLDEVYHIEYPYTDSFFGYLIQKYKPYRVEYYDLFWKPINEEDILHIKKRKRK